MTIKQAYADDLPAIMSLLEMGRQTMRRNGNTFQWNGYPTENQILADIADGNSYLICHNNTPVATFAMIIGEEPTYQRIYNGKWLNDTLPYATIHRLAGTPQYRGLGKMCFDWVWQNIHNIRIDTHRRNAILRHLAETNGFSYCGIIHLANGDERMAFQKVES
ncbi:MAG: GNAT family N-acetyltransferase [Bacteroidales bacterium]|nr:GNAT family N-acetyltransferase [Bacteroidales bacterium]